MAVVSETINRIVKLVELFNEEIRQALDGKNITNTGTAKDSLRIESSDGLVRDFGIFYLEFLDSGRGPGGVSVSNIRLWVVQKLGITDADEIESATYAISNKIAALGNEIFLHPEKGLELTKKILSLKNNILIETRVTAKVDVTKVLNRFDKIRKLKLQI